MRRRSLPNAPDGPKLGGEVPRAWGRGKKKREKKGAARLGPLDRAFGHPARAPNERASIGPSGCVAAEAPQMA